MHSLVLLFLGAQFAVGLPQASNQSAPSDPAAAFPLPSGFLEYSDLSTNGTPATPGSTVTKINYGPFSCSAQDMASTVVANMKLPCTNCYLTAIQAGLEYPNGTVANSDTGAWLHHIVAYDQGKRDTVCSNTSMPLRVFASGNERAVLRINGNYDYGIKVDAADTMALLYELMNMSDEDQQYVITIVSHFLLLLGRCRESCDSESVWVNGESDLRMAPRYIFYWPKV